METDMTAKLPILPIVLGSLARAVADLASFTARRGSALARALRHRREVRALAGLDGYMLADIGINRADLNDAFSAPFWEDPTALLRERALERRLFRAGPPPRPLPPQRKVEPGFSRPATNRPARQAV
jgi:uncharacterized protein YjiS (DUF1127 family)